MKVYDTGSIRNVAVVGHSGAGKTQLAAALLFAAGAMQPLRPVDDGTTVTDYDDEEIASKHTLSASPRLRRVEQAQDQPHRYARHGATSSATRARRCASPMPRCVVVDAVAGVEVQTEKVWAEAEALGLPRLSSSTGSIASARASTARCLPSRLLQPHHHADPAADRRGEGLHAASSTWSR